MNTDKKCPLITVITVVFNGEKFIEETILSVINQSFRNIEYIVIDGGSNDGTVDIIKKYTNKISYWISEPDKGIYDAMNKGIRAAKGDWFNFLNASDTYIDNHVLKNIFSCELNDATIIYGDIKVLRENGKSHYHKAITLKNDKSIIKGMKVCHQAIFYHRDIIHLYDTSLRIKSEWKHLIEMTRKPNFKPLKINSPIVYYRLGGLSASLASVNRKEYRKVFLEKYGWPNYIKQFPYLSYMAVRRIFKGILLKLRVI